MRPTIAPLQTPEPAEKTIEELDHEQAEEESRKSAVVDQMSNEELDAYLESKKTTSMISDKPFQRKVTVTVSYRDPELSAAMKRKAGYSCQLCGQPTFEGKDGHNFTESHHVIPRGKKGADDPRNIIIVCPNCHRKFDAGNAKTQMDVYKKIKEKNLFADFDTLKKMRAITTEIYDSAMK